jgi:hypothetical protein
MVEKDGSEYLVGYKRPPRHTQFKPGQSGNLNGRPKKGTTFAEAFQKELHTSITILEGGKRRKVTKLAAIAKQQTNKAVGGDAKATAMVMNAVEPRQFDPTDSLSPVLHEMKAIHARHEAANRNGAQTTDASDLTGNASSENSGDHKQVDDGQN